MFHRRSLLLAAGATALARPARAEHRALRAADGVEIGADFLTASAKRRGVILLFHQAGANRGEYDTIAPRLNRLGFDTLAIDQRSGGNAFGHRNETAGRLGHEFGFAAALPDLEAALASAKAPVLVWGSSYSAALVFVLAARHPNAIAALLAFSPGEYIDGISIRAAAAKVTSPVFVTSASNEQEETTAADILKTCPAGLKRQYKSKAGTHGSSTLRQVHSEDVWQAVERFLDDAVPT